MSKIQNNAVVVDACTKRLNALRSYVDAKAQIGINGEKHKLSQVIALYQSCLDSRASLATKRAELKAAMAVRADAEEARREADRALKAWVENEFGVGSQQAIDFGFPAPKKATRTVESKVQAVALAKATRLARHTMGKKQKSLIKGTTVVPAAPEVPAIHAPAGASTASQPGTIVVAQAAPPSQSQQTMPVNGASAPTNGTSANGAAAN